MEEDDEYESHWHLVDCTLNRALGYGIAPEELAERITTGTINLSGICEWLQTVLHWPGVTRDLLEGKMNCLKDALIIWYVDLLHVRPLHIHSIHHSGATTSDMGVGSTSRGRPRAFCITLARNRSRTDLVKSPSTSNTSKDKAEAEASKSGADRNLYIRRTYLQDGYPVRTDMFCIFRRP